MGRLGVLPDIVIYLFFGHSVFVIQVSFHLALISLLFVVRVLRDISFLSLIRNVGIRPRLLSHLALRFLLFDDDWFQLMVAFDLRVFFEGLG